MTEPAAPVRWAVTAYLAKLLQAPVVLVIDARASARTAAAVALGFRLFDPEVGSPV